MVGSVNNIMLTHTLTALYRCKDKMLPARLSCMSLLFIAHLCPALGWQMYSIVLSNFWALSMVQPGQGQQQLLDPQHPGQKHCQFEIALVIVNGLAEPQSLRGRRKNLICCSLRPNSSVLSSLFFGTPCISTCHSLSQNSKFDKANTCLWREN